MKQKKFFIIGGKRNETKIIFYNRFDIISSYLIYNIHTSIR